MKKYALFLSLILFSTSMKCTKLQTQDPSPSEQNYDFSKIDKLLSDNLQNAYAGKVYTEIQQNGKVIYSKGLGGYDQNSIALIASGTKTFSAIVILSLVDDGLLKLDDKIGKYLPIFNTYGKGDCTIRQCFSHTSGFPGSETEELLSSKTISLEEAVDGIAKNIKMQFTPGSTFAYGGVSMHIAGRVAEVVSGKSWNQLFKEKVIDKLGLKNSSYLLNEKNPRISGGMISSPNDIMKLNTMILNKGLFEGKRVLSENMINELFKDQTNNATIFYSPVPTIKYGFGCWLDIQNSQTKNVEQISGDGAFGTIFWIDRCRNITGVSFTFSTFVNANPTTQQVSAEVRNIVGSGCK